MRTIYNSNTILIPFSNIEMAVNILEAEEIAFTLVTNKKSKGKTKVSSFPSNDFRNKILLVSRAPSLSKTIITSIALKPAITYFVSAIAVITTSKPT